MTTSHATRIVTGDSSDALAGVEGLSGSGRGDLLTGSTASEALFGSRGTDCLRGLGDTDMLGGGTVDYTLDPVDGVSGNDLFNCRGGTDACARDVTERSVAGCER